MSQMMSQMMGQMKKAVGSFEVKIQPLANTDVTAEPLLGRMLLVKKFTGDLEADARGQMLTATTATKGSAVYVAIDHVQGRLAGREGGFMLHHTGVMDRGAPTLSVRVVPDSGTGELAGLSGDLRINIVDGKHFYEFDYCFLEHGLPGE
jgi:hypothetical protein